MFQTKNITGQTALLISFLSCYALLSLFVDFLHDHKADWRFHDNCPACQWEKQHQDDHSEFGTILALFADVINRPVQKILQENHSCQNQAEKAFSAIRAPPSISYS